MTIVTLRRAEADDATLLRRARRGDRRAARLFSRRHAARAVELVELLVDDRDVSAQLAAHVIATATADGVAGDDALVQCAVRVAAPVSTTEGLARLVVALVDGEGRTEGDVAELIGRSSTDVAELRSLAYADVAPLPVRTRECRGWPLVARRDRLTPAEREAATGHLSLCRQCRARLDEQRQTRDKIWVRGGAVSAVVVADVVSLSLPAGGAVAGSGAASVVLGKAGMAIVGATALAVTATSAGIAVARTNPAHPHRAPAPAVAPASGSSTGSATSTDPGHTITGSQSGGATVSTPPATAPAGRKAPGPTVLPTAFPSGVPTVSVPVQLPTKIPTLPPLPTPSVSVPPLPLPTGSSLLGR